MPACVALCTLLKLPLCHFYGLLLHTMQKLHTRVESGSDDPDNVGHLGHFFEGSSGSHPQTKLSGCDPDILIATSGVC